MHSKRLLSSASWPFAQSATAEVLPPAAPDLGPLPEWNLADLYPSMESELYSADVARAEAECKSFAAEYRGKLQEIARSPDAGTALAVAVRRYEAIEDLLGRIMSYAGLVYAGNTSDPIRAKFYGDAQDKITTASTDLLFFQLELNRIDSALLDKAMQDSPL